MSEADAVHRFSDCRLTVGQGGWDFARDHSAEIDAHWTRRHAQNPAMFNGVIYVTRHWRANGPVFEATMLRTDFKSCLYWRETGFPETGVRDGFGSALLRSAEGDVVLGRQRAGNINAGLSYLPGGFIDDRDATAAGTIDIDASIEREVAEETGLGAGDLERRPGFLVTVTGPQISIAREFRSALPAAALAARIRDHIAADPASELADVVVVRTPSDIDSLAMPKYARIVLSHVLPA